MIKIEIDVNVKGLDFLKDLLSSNLSVSNGGGNTPAWTTNEVPKENIPQPVVPEQPVPQTPTQPIDTAPVSEVAYTLQQLSDAAIGLVQSGKIQSTDLSPILINEFGVDAMHKMAPEQYNLFALKLKELGGVI